ncbi:glycolate oxidase subunit GlcE [Rhodoblastus acidophilus]|uniref:Glycolate oxidase subunit GlcE n=1 Tax=Candidatus Rhodoblastus alkanivorans TaxID=2954117 RepID=A0ABS9Z1I5_9HYPH|nr:glycolate oxidase subunit GlcE [Candidatus Rhodoblastus alkanivorans]MCI4680485.1 glycolate oxidase subunit GlcE [Candidatus Rhodoblastus alkanivorans]MCI4681185.1 glycolate oxidase subunit GlcE [Candidatus Rhodoblastus alkanivorans]MDI4642228.1 glycolate oxidase subunit GlcE [Rhodoblastus acidophilus]
MTELQPADADEAAEIILWAATEGKTLEICAGRSKRALGRATTTDAVLDISRLAGVVQYEPAELILTARPGTPLKEIEALLEGKGQMLAFEPPDWRGLLGGGGEPTLGGTIACNLSGPRRARAGAARDFFLGFSGVNGRGERFKAGGKVVKNVTGYDLCKLMAGSFGTLALLTEVTVKVTPRPESACTLLIPGLTDEAAGALMSKALNTPFEVSAAAHLPSAAARRLGFAESGLTALRIEGPAPSIAFRADALEQILGSGPRLDAGETAALWRKIGEAAPLLPQGERVVWRLCPTPSAAAALISNLRGELPLADFFYDWAGGLIWLSLDATEAGPDAGAEVVRAALKPHGGHATLVVANAEMRAKVAVFEPEAPALAALSRRLKQGYDPCGALNPGRMREAE